MSTFIRLLILIATLWAVQHYFGDQITGAFSSKENKELPIEDIEKHINSKLPLYYDNNDVSWDSFKLRPFIAIYNFTLTNATKAEIGDVYFNVKAHRKFTQIICKTEGIDELVKRDMAFRVSFHDRNGEFIKSINGESTECRHISY